MQTLFTDHQRADPDIQISEQVLRKCVHCGFCTATCPTFILLGDELDSPRGRIYLIKDMLENEKPANEKVVKHIDRCLSCLSCMTTCPSGVHYMHLVDHAREHIEKTYRRPFADRAVRSLLALLLPRPGLFRLALVGALLARPFASLLPGRLRGLLSMAPDRLESPSPVDRPGVHAAIGARKKRVALLTGCAQKVLDPEINEATVRLLTRHGCEVVVSSGAGCCGALTHHLGKTEDSLGWVKANIDAWCKEIDGEGLDAIVVNASGCGTVVKDYGFMLRNDQDWKDRAQAVSDRAKDISELMTELGLKATGPRPDLTVAYHAACSLQHGQQIKEPPKALLRDAGFTVKEVPEGHICCGSAGTYNMLQPELAGRLKARKLSNITSLSPDVIAAGNIGCMSQLAGGTDIPVVHTAAMLDWASGGPVPKALVGKVPA